MPTNETGNEDSASTTVKANETTKEAVADPLTRVRDSLLRAMVRKLGVPASAILIVLSIAYVKLDLIKTLPGIPWVLTQLREMRGVPHATGDRFSIVVARLDNDENGAHLRVLREALATRTGIELLMMDRAISIEHGDKPQNAIRAGHKLARQLLTRSDADVLIWGTALDADPQGPMRLHWTSAVDARFKKSAETYRPQAQDLDLPELFWIDLSDVLGLMVSARAAELPKDTRFYLADQIKPFIDRVRALLQSEDLRKDMRNPIRAALADALHTYGHQKDDAQALKEAVETYQQVVHDHNREHEGFAWAKAQNDLGTAFWSLGGVTGNESLAYDAVAAHREALKEFTRERAPYEWATTQNYIGIELQTLAPAIEDIKEAITAHKLARLEFDRKRAPLDWATTQNNLGTALRILGERTSDVKILKEAVAVHRSGLEVYTLEHYPLHWAQAQNNLGLALASLGAAAYEHAYLLSGANAHREALRGRLRSKAPLEWAMSNRNLAMTLVALSSMTGKIEPLEPGVLAFKESLKEFTRDRSPYDWAVAQMGLAQTLQLLGLKTANISRLEEALVHFELAVTVFTRERSPHRWAAVQFNLATLLSEVGKRRNDSTQFPKAILAARSAVAAFSQVGNKSWRDKARVKLAHTLQISAEQKCDKGQFNESLSEFESLFTEQLETKNPFAWAPTLLALADMLQSLGTCSKDTFRLERSAAAYTLALEFYRAHPMTCTSPSDCDMRPFELKLRKTQDMIRELSSNPR